MKSYKDFPKISIGTSDISTLIMIGFTNKVYLMPLYFGHDGTYNAYLVKRKENETVEIGSHYTKIATFNYWLKIYDDQVCTFNEDAKEINIYRSGEFGCIIEVIEED